MKALWITLGVVAFLGLLCCGGVIFAGKRLFDKGMQAVNEAMEIPSGAQTYADESIRAIATSWDAKELEKRASSQLKAETSHGQFVRLMEQCKAKLGGLKTLGTHGSVQFNSGATTSEGAFQAVGMTVSATFQKGPAEIRITVVKTGTEWQINEFRVNWPL